jgi:pyrrolidone-carboxylate peptidase
MAKPVLVTGFTPFGSHDVNISQVVAESLVGQEVRGHPIEVEILSVDEAG